MDQVRANRAFLRATDWEQFASLETDQRRGVPMPPPEESVSEGAERIALPPAEALSLGSASLVDVLRTRRSRRQFTDVPLTIEELSFLLWATQGVVDTTGRGGVTRRAVPSGGARHPFETYLWLRQVAGLDAGLYRYLPMEHALCLLRRDDGLGPAVREAARGQRFVAEGAVTFLWVAVPYRTEWRYGPVAAKIIAQDSGHLCQNLYLACEAIGAGTCAIGAYDQAKADALLGLDGEEQFVIYMAPVGKVQ